MSPRTLAVCGALLLALAAPAAAGAAPVMEPLGKPCFVSAGPGANQREGVPIAASGFSPNSLVDLTIDGQTVGTGLQVDANGAIGKLAPLFPPVPFIARGTGRFTITLAEQGNPANTVSATARHVALGVSLKPQSAAPSTRIRFKGAGFTRNKPVYAHYVFGGEVRRTVKMSRNPDACGQWRKRSRQIPVAEPREGIWTVQFDQLKKYREPTVEFPSAYVQVRIRVTRILG